MQTTASRSGDVQLRDRLHFAYLGVLVAVAIYDEVRWWRWRTQSRLQTVIPRAVWRSFGLPPR